MSAAPNSDDGPRIDLGTLAQMAASDPNRAIELLEKELREDMLGAYNIDLIKRLANTGLCCIDKICY